MEQQISRFREQMRAEFGGPPKRGARYSRGLRAQALALVQQGLDQGWCLSAVARELGLPKETVRRWQAAAAAPAGSPELRLVKVVVPGAVGPQGGEGSDLVVFSASGYRVEGLSLAQVVQLLEVLG